MRLLLSNFQGLLVRDLKAKQDKSVWQPQVQILLQLKKQLADLQGPTSKTQNPASNEAKASKTPEAAPISNGDVKLDTTALEAEIAKQGLLVREFKAKEEKSVWQPQVEILLKLKNQLEELSGGPPTVDKKSKKKKK